MSNRTRKLRLAFGFAILVSLLGGFVAGMIALNGRDSAPVAVLVVAIAVILGVAFAAMLPWWRGLDHMQRDSHLVTWFWGGSFGGAVGLLLIVMLDREPNQLMLGGALVWLAQMVGYGIAFLGWKIAHRAADT